MLEVIRKLTNLASDLKENHNTRCYVVLAETESERLVIDAIEAVVKAHRDLTKSLLTIDSGDPKSTERP